MEQVFIIKLGGQVLDHPAVIASVLDQVAALQQPTIVVHGGGKVATRLGTRLGIEPQYHQGRRITDADTLELVTMVYAGLINKQLVAQLQQRGVNAIGLTGADANLIPAVKRPVREVDFGWVGDVQTKAIPVESWQLFLNAKLLPVVAPITHNQQGQLLNTNADTIAASIAVALSATFEVHLVYCFDMPGVMRDIQDASSLVRSLNPAGYQLLREEGCLSDGILPKLDNAFAAIHQGVRSVILLSPDHLHTCLDESPFGTQITA